MADISPSDEEMNLYGGMLATSQFAGAMLGGALLAVQIFMVIYGLSVFLSTPKEQRKGRLRFIVISWVILVTFSVDTLLDISTVFRILFTGGPTGISYLEADELVWQADKKLGVIGDSFLTVAVTLGDILMLWRCVVLWNDKKWVVALPALTCIGDIVCQIIYLIPDKFAAVEGPIDATKVSVALISLSVALNIMVTCLILLKLISTRLSMAKVLPDRKLPSMYSEVTAIIIESASPLALFGIFLVIVIAIERWHLPKGMVQVGKVHVLLEILDWLYNAFCALSPQMIIFRVTTGQSWKSAADSNKGAATFSQPIHFAREVQESSSSNVSHSA
ncbi:hypothetical protein BKA70DRAFT_1184942 [Coprinopsis sp. MPI-PUGE-AT-0042]|nr:hypothetical protein BKA70DRAFT_1184942 [Coprinopsis sp. MPI-PUGE-AT-0042]